MIAPAVTGKKILLVKLTSLYFLRYLNRLWKDKKSAHLLTEGERFVMQ